jgi:hypothetical protein
MADEYLRHYETLSYRKSAWPSCKEPRRSV